MTLPPPSRSTPEIDGIQYLRAIAALMVVAHHARHFFEASTTWSTFGSRGVDIFFVISGFIMAHSTANYRPDGPRGPQAMDFLLKRVIRVVPLYWIALLWTAKRELIAGPWTWDLVGDLFFVPHFHRVYTASVFPALVPGWTINYEMFFYAVFAASLLQGVFRYRFVTLVLLGLVSLGAVAWQGAAAIFYTSSVMIEFLFGIFVWFAITRLGMRIPKPAAIAICVLAAAGLAIENSDASRGFMDGPFAAVLVWSALHWISAVRIDWLHKLGDASYSIYLFHLAAFWIPDHLLRLAGVWAPTPLNVAVVIALHMATAIGVGLVIHRWLERPLLGFLRARLARSPLGLRAMPALP